ncbi:MAG TPA: LysM peptidoglycan-binding domain-containing protein, partial [Gemmataceae bacterium]|nr:LysM peptidoglycan-binding domain-containing protein [Gemmataceae bacterium]
GGRALPPAAIGRDGGYDEDLHAASPNDNFQTISKRYYEDESYASALAQYNRDNPGNGRYVRIPPIEVLMKRYPNATPKTPARPTSSGSPASLNLQGDANPLPIAARENPVYTVPEGGETLRDIAQKTLGNGEYWRYIYDLNSSLNPAEKLPAGTKLRLPPQARVQ